MELKIPWIQNDEWPVRSIRHFGRNSRTEARASTAISKVSADNPRAQSMHECLPPRMDGLRDR